MMTYLSELSFFNAFNGAPPGRRLLRMLAVCLLAGVHWLPVTATAQTPGSAMVNINTADAATLAERLTGVGLTRAQEIVRYRENFGDFGSVDELAEVRGIGAATVDKNRPRIVLE